MRYKCVTKNIEQLLRCHIGSNSIIVRFDEEPSCVALVSSTPGSRGAGIVAINFPWSKIVTLDIDGLFLGLY